MDYNEEMEARGVITSCGFVSVQLNLRPLLQTIGLA